MYRVSLEMVDPGLVEDCDDLDNVRGIEAPDGAGQAKPWCGEDISGHNDIRIRKSEW